jgi:hypothetical protein
MKNGEISKTPLTVRGGGSIMAVLRKLNKEKRKERKPWIIPN